MARKKKMPDLTTAGPMHGAALALESLVWILNDDPRVQRAYAECWKHPTRAHVVETVQRLTREELGIPYPCVAELLAMRFAAVLTGHRKPRVEVTADPPKDMPHGRQPMGVGEHIFRDVKWYYQAKIAVRPVSVNRLAKEYAVATNRRTRANSVVQTGIARAQHLLSIFTAADGATGELQPRGGPEGAESEAR